MFSIRATAALLIAGLLLPLAAPAGDTQEDRVSLRNIKAIQLKVADPGVDLERGGYTRDIIQTEVEVRLRQAGIHLTDQKDAPMLFVAVTAVKGGLFSTYAYYVELSIVQPVRLMREPDIATSATTWSINELGQSKRARDVRDEVNKLADRFANTFLAINPKS